MFCSLEKTYEDVWLGLKELCYKKLVKKIPPSLSLLMTTYGMKLKQSAHRNWAYNASVHTPSYKLQWMQWILYVTFVLQHYITFFANIKCSYSTFSDGGLNTEFLIYPLGMTCSIFRMIVKKDKSYHYVIEEQRWERAKTMLDFTRFCKFLQRFHQY